jgi:hypothetical protein
LGQRRSSDLQVRAGFSATADAADPCKAVSHEDRRLQITMKGRECNNKSEGGRTNIESSREIETWPRTAHHTVFKP